MENLICDSCGKSYSRDKAFAVYSKKFCSLDCLRPYKLEQDDKNKPKTDSQTFRKPDMGGSTCF